MKGPRITSTERVFKEHANRVGPTAYNIRKGANEKVLLVSGKINKSPRIPVTSDSEFLS